MGVQQLQDGLCQHGNAHSRRKCQKACGKHGGGGIPLHGFPVLPGVSSGNGRNGALPEHIGHGGYQIEHGHCQPGKGAEDKVCQRSRILSGIPGKPVRKGTGCPGDCRMQTVHAGGKIDQIGEIGNQGAGSHRHQHCKQRTVQGTVIHMAEFAPAHIRRNAVPHAHMPQHQEQGTRCAG